MSESFHEGVHLTSGWLHTWLPQLSATELKTYLAIARSYESRPARLRMHVESLLTSDERGRLDAALVRLEELGLIERPNPDSLREVHLPCRDPEGRHHAEAVMPSIREALRFQRAMAEELLDLSGRDETAELRARTFERHPALARDYELYASTSDDSFPRWRLWLEVSRWYIHEFETNFGALKATHNETFKKTAAQILQHKVDVVDAVSREVFEARDRVFSESGDGWIVSPRESAFSSRPLIQRLSSRYGIGSEQILLNTLELTAQSGYVIVELDGASRLIDMLLPSTTGLTKSEERILYLLPEERERGVDSQRNRERSRRALNKYANHLMNHGARVLYDFVQRDRVVALDELLRVIAARVNENLELVPSSYEAICVDLEHVLEKYNDIRELKKNARVDDEA